MSIEKYTEYIAPKNPKITINQLKAIIGIERRPLNSIINKNGGRIKAIAAEPIEPAMFKKSVKFGIKSDMPVIIQTIIDLTTTLLNF